MKKSIHPQFSEDTTVLCSCGNTFKTGSVIKWEIRVESCNKCHPFFSGENRLIKTSNLDKFNSRAARAKEMQAK